LPGPGGGAPRVAPEPGGGTGAGRQASWRALASIVAPGIPTCEAHLGSEAGPPSAVVDGPLAEFLRKLAPWPSR
ncbi:MAG: hypothetical protein AB7V45_12120, partial [Candidatus Krumholzibacteriia bacterium]